MEFLHTLSACREHWRVALNPKLVRAAAPIPKPWVLTDSRLAAYTQLVVPLLRGYNLFRLGC